MRKNASTAPAVPRKMLSLYRPWRMCRPDARLTPFRLGSFLCTVILMWTGHSSRLLAETTRGQSEVRLSSPRGICVDADGNILVASRDNNSVVLLRPRPTLRYQERVSESPFVPYGVIEGEKGGRLSRPHDVAVDAAGRIIVADTGNDLVKIYSNILDSRRYSVEHLRGPLGRRLFSAPEGVATDPQGNLIVFDTGGGKLHIFSPDLKGGAVISGSTNQKPPDVSAMQPTTGPFLGAPIDGCSFGDGYLAVADRFLSTYSVWKYDPKSPRPETCQFVGYGPPCEDAANFSIRSIAYNSQRRYLAFLGTNLPLRDSAFLYFQPVEVDDPARVVGGRIACTLRIPLTGWLDDSGRLAFTREGDLFITDTASDSFQRISRESFPVLNSPVSVDAQQTRATLKYFSTAEVATRLEYGAVPISVGPVISLGRTHFDPAEIFAHTVKLDGLLPSTRYAFRYLLSEDCFSSSSAAPVTNYSKTRLLATQSAPRRIEYLDFPLDVLVFPGVPTENLHSQLEFTRLFFWVNSRMTCNLKPNVISVEEGRRLPQPAILKQRGEETALETFFRDLANFSSSRTLFVIAPEASYDETLRNVLPATCGLNRPGGSVSFFAHTGDDQTASFIRQYHRQLSIMHFASGRSDALSCLVQDPGSDRSHVAWDSIADVSRSLGRNGWLANRHGVFKTTADNDEDGVVDDDPNCPLDEKRFGTSPAKPDTDGDGVGDLAEVLFSRWATEFPVDGARVIANHFRPSPSRVDTDRDSIPDSLDANPLCPLEDRIRRLDITVDGRISQGEWDYAPSLSIAENAYNGVLRVAWNRACLFFSLTGSGPAVAQGPPSIRIRLDGTAEGFLRGSDHLTLLFEPDSDGSFTVRLEEGAFGLLFGTCASSTTPWTGVSRTTGFWTMVQDALQAEIAIPRSPEIGLHLFGGEETAFDFEILPKGASLWLRVFEPLMFFRATLKPPDPEMEMPD